MNFLYSLSQVVLVTGREAVPAVQNEAENAKSDLPGDFHVHHVVQPVGGANAADHRLRCGPVHEANGHRARVVSAGAPGYHEAGGAVERRGKVLTGGFCGTRSFFL